MKSAADHHSAFDQLVSQLGDCLTPESARRILNVKADSLLQARIDELAERHKQGLLQPNEQAEYGRYISFSTIVAILKSKARQLLVANSGE